MYFCVQLKAIEERQREEAKAQQERLSEERNQDKLRAQQQLAEAEAKHMASITDMYMMSKMQNSENLNAKVFFSSLMSWAMAGFDCCHHR